ncbi:MAG: hypothetical protein HY231_20850 [Acidobacteria bacterium]|nr:hypothetical protein [Acidobacteriota bacterium]
MAKHEMDEVPDVSYIRNVGVAHEESDLSLGGIGKFVIHLIVLVAASAVIVYGMFKYFSAQEYAQEKSERPSTLLKREQRASGEVKDIFPEPRLQTLPIPDLAAYRAAEEYKLESYGWVDKEKSLVRIPIEEAKQKFLEEMNAKSAASASAAQMKTAAAAQTQAPSAPTKVPMPGKP